MGAIRWFSMHGNRNVKGILETSRQQAQEGILQDYMAGISRDVENMHLVAMHKLTKVQK